MENLGLLSCSFLSAKDDIDNNSIEKIANNVDFVHLDIIDGVFATGDGLSENLTEQIFKYTTKQDVHLMVKNPESYIQKFARDSVEFITFHIESKCSVEKTIALIKHFGIKPGIAINPETNVRCIKDFLNDVNLVLVMGVNPGLPGQKFHPETLLKIKELKAIKENEGYQYLIAVDGGITRENINQIKIAGCDIFVIGSKIIDANNPLEEALAFSLNIKKEV